MNFLKITFGISNPKSVGFYYSVFAIMAGYFCFTIGDTFLKDLAGNGDELGLLGATSFYGAVEIFALNIIINLFKKENKQTFKTTVPFVHLIKSILVFVSLVFITISIARINFSQFYAILYTMPIWVAIFGTVFFKFPFRYFHAITICVGFLGVLVVVQSGLTDSFGIGTFSLTEPFFIGIFSVLLAAMGFALSNSLTPKVPTSENPLNLILYARVLSFLVLGKYTYDYIFMNPSLGVQSKLFFQGFFSSIGSVFIGRGYQFANPVSVAPISYTQIIIGGIIGYVFWSEVPDLYTIIGALIIIASTWYLLIKESKS